MAAIAMMDGDDIASLGALVQVTEVEMTIVISFAYLTFMRLLTVVHICVQVQRPADDTAVFLVCFLTSTVSFLEPSSFVSLSFIYILRYCHKTRQWCFHDSKIRHFIYIYKN